MIIIFNDQGDTLSVQKKLDSNTYKIINYKNNQPDNFKTFINDQKHGDWLYKKEDTTFLGFYDSSCMYSYVLKAYNDTIIDSYFEFNKDYRLWLHINNDPKKHSSFLTYRNDSIYVDTANFKKQSNSLVAPTKFIYYSNLNERYKKDLMTDSTIYYNIQFPYNSNRGSLTLVSYPKSNESDSSYIYPFIIPEKLDLISERSEHLKTLLK